MYLCTTYYDHQHLNECNLISNDKYYLFNCKNSHGMHANNIMSIFSNVKSKRAILITTSIHTKMASTHPELYDSDSGS